MKNLLLITFIFTFGISFSQTLSDCSVPAILFNEYEEDVKDLALIRVFELNNSDTAQIIIPQAYQDTIWLGLGAIFNASSIIERDSVFDIYCIHNISPNTSLLGSDIYVGVDNSYPWTTAWANGNTVTGNIDIDNLVSEYDFELDYYSQYSHYARLTTTQLINRKAFCDSLATFSGVNYAERSANPGDANSIFYTRIGEELFYDFKLGISDCASMCINYHTWKFKVNINTCIVEYLGFVQNGSIQTNNPYAPNCNISTDIKTLKKELKSVVFPNPTTGKITIESSNVEQIGIYSLSGVLIESTNNKEIDLSQEAKGIYFVKIMTKENIEIMKLIIE